MADFFSRIFAIPSDISSNCSPESLGNGISNAGGSGKGHSRSLTPLSVTDGNGTATSQSFGEGTLSYDSDSLEGSEEHPSSTSTSSETVEEHSDVHREGETNDILVRRQYAPRGATASTICKRGRQRRSDVRAHRSVSEQPRRINEKKCRSSSMASSKRRTNSNNRFVSSRNMQLQLSSPKKPGRRHRSLSTMGARTVAPPKEMTRVNSWSSGEKERCHGRLSSSTPQKSDKSINSQHQRLGNVTVNSSSRTKKKEKKEKKDWRSKLAGGMKKHLSPGTGGGAAPPKEKHRINGGKKKHQINVAHCHTNRKIHHKSGRESMLNKPSVPINVGDSIVISQQFLEDNAEMSVLTLPRELVAMNEATVVEEFDKTIQEVSQRTVLEHDYVQAFVDCREGHRSRIGAYASRILGENNQSYSQDNGAAERKIGEGTGVRPITHDECKPSSIQGNTSLPCSLKEAGNAQPPPPPPPLPQYVRSPKKYASLDMPKQMATTDAPVAAPHWNPPANSNSESIATSYNDPPGTLVASHTFQMHPSDGTEKKSDPSGDPYRPFDEISNSANSAAFQHHGTATKRGVLQAAEEKNLRSNKAVTFSLPPYTHPPAPPFMGPPLDYYYSMERNSDIDGPIPCWSSSSLSPPIVELWASIESADNVPGDVIGGSAVISGTWDEKREKALLGEDSPLHISQEWLESTEKTSATVESLCSDILNPATPVSEQEGALCQRSLAGKQQHPGSSAAYSWEEDTPHDEYFNVGSFVDGRKDFADLAAKEKCRQLNHRESANHSSDQSVELEGDDDGADFRHRSMWMYKPPKLILSESDTVSRESKCHHEWQQLVRVRIGASITIQKFARGFLERRRISLLLDSLLIIQPFIRRYLSRKRHRDYLKLKRSYYPNRWKTSNMLVAL